MADVFRLLNDKNFPTTATAGTQGLQSSTVKFSWIFQAEESITCDRVNFSGYKVGTPPTYRIGIQGVNTSGNPDGSYLTSTTFVPGGTAFVTQEFELTFTGQSLTRGNFYSIVIEYSSGTINASNYLMVNQSRTQSVAISSSSNAVPYYAYYNGSSWSSKAYSPMVAYGTSSKYYGVGYLPVCTNITTSSTTFANCFKIPTDVCSTYKINGVAFAMLMAGGTTIDVKLFDAGSGVSVTSTQLSETVDNDAVPGSLYARVYYFTGTLPTLNAGTYYRIGLTPSTGPTTFVRQDFSSANVMKASWGEDYIYGSTRTTGDWTDTTLSKYPIVPMISDMTGGGSSGGLIIPRTFTGF